MAEPVCKYYGKCGGCSLQHLDYEMQIENKKKALQSILNFNDLKVFSLSPYHYRNRMDFIFTENGIGLREKKKWWRIVNIDECAIANHKINQLMKEIKSFFVKPDYFDIKKHTGTLRYAVIRASRNDSSISFVINEDSARREPAIERIQEFAKITSANNILVTLTPPKSDVSTSENFFVIKGQERMTETLLGKKFVYSVQGFFQNNTEMAEKMQEYCNSILKAKNTGNAHLLDLYSGVGTFGIINAPIFRSSTMIESVKECIEAANENIRLNRINNAKAILLDAKHLSRIKIEKPLYVILDPPRSGMHEKTIQQINALQPETIIYVSCNPNQLGKDIKKFKDYRLVSAALFDMFPQTEHMEAVAELAK